MKKMLIVFFLLLRILPLLSQDYNYGLHFVSYPAKTTEMSSLILEDNQSIPIEEETCISFNMNVRNENAFGTIFRIITNTKKNIDFFFTVDDGDQRYPILVLGENVYPINCEIAFNEWIPVSICFSGKENEISFSYGSSRLTTSYSVSQLKSIQMVFGQCLFEGFKLSDLASFNLRDVRVTQNKKLTRFWKLEMHHKDVCYDSVKQVPALATNPQWMIDQYSLWKKIYSQSADQYVSFAFNSQSNEFYLVSDAENVRVFNASDGKISDINVKGGSLASMAPGRLYFDADRGNLISYSLENKAVSFFSFASQTWSDVVSDVEDQMLNNSVTFNPADSTLLSFGGYGFYRYNNILTKLNPYTKQVEDLVLRNIDPRYAAALTVYNNVLYVFGGRGCKSGRQELSPHNYCDLYAVDLTTGKTTMLWENSSIPEDFLASENMIYDETNKCFYVLSTYNTGSLLKIDTQKNTYELMAQPIGTNFSAEYLYTSLYYSPNREMIYVLVNRSNRDESFVEIFSLTNPPIPLAKFHQDAAVSEGNPSFANRQLIGIVLLLLVAIAIGSLYYLRYRKNKKEVTGTLSQQTNKDIEPFNRLPEDIKDAVITEQYYDFSKSCVCLLGGFMVKDKDGNDITEHFTPILKHLLILLIVYSVQNSKGIAGSKLIQILWYDKMEDSAKNNRNVYLSKMRLLIEKIGDVKIMNKHGFLTVNFGDDSFCDYVEAMRYFSEIKESNIQEQEIYYRLQELLLRGTLLPNTETDWIDNFKSNFSNMTLDTLHDLFLQMGDKFDADYKLKIADTIFLHDCINEEALHIKCSVLSQSGKKGIAKNVYVNFCKEYENLLDINYRHSLSEVIKKVIM